MANLQKAIKVINKRIPKSYHTNFKVYKTIYSMLRSVANNNFNGNYGKCLNYYDNYFKNPETNTYVKSKYFKIHRNKIKRTRRVFNISMFGGGNPIIIAKDNIANFSQVTLTAFLLHEIGHTYYRNKYSIPIPNEERMCDEFAIRWTRKLIKEGLL